MKILVITSQRITGLNYHRQVIPFANLDIETNDVHKWDFDFTDEYLKQFQCVSFLRTIDVNGRTTEICERLTKLGIKIHFDIDDYWVLPNNHPLYKGYKAQNIGLQTVEAIKNADFVTTTTPYLAERIKEYHEKVYVLPNAIDPEQEQWKHELIPNELTRFGYIAGVHHNADVELLQPNMYKLWKDASLYKKFQLSIAGFNLNKFHAGDVFLNAYYYYVEQIFTDNHKYIKNQTYKDYLRIYKPNPLYRVSEEDKDKVIVNPHKEITALTNPTVLSQFKDEAYNRIYGLDTFNYGRIYNFIDVSLVPLHQTMFSSLKSQLKLIEAGFMKKAVIVSDVKPYDLLATQSNSYLIKPTRNHIDWYIAMKKLINEPNMRNDLAEQLYLDVKDKYHIKTVNIERKQIFEANV